MTKQGVLLLFKEEDGFDRLYFSRDRAYKYFTIAWNPGESHKAGKVGICTCEKNTV